VWAFGALLPACLPGIPRSCWRIALALAGVGELMNFGWCGAVGLNWPVPTLVAGLPLCPAFSSQPLPEALVAFCDEVAALTDAAASAATSSVTIKAMTAAKLRRFTDSSPLDSNFFSPPPQTALQQTLPSSSSPPF